ncbi:Gamma interferon inducible lysosomal thiol reductase GILT [Metarhizium rileyi]|uniref:Gamma interferon inducible lysosomal thiol reductase GILT n=1 Tax=Metarhizium rileyi (strain RCEF 4871) TaxID=1649241 RepID=A0A162LZV4_METRR|nr:Gamma interferon inducible lysosomal thiol reductase GILT [Metarhizium rileyi RCEF 4871]
MSPLALVRRILLPILAILLLLRGVYVISYRKKFDRSGTTHLVPLEAHIISKCPDTRDALKQLILPVMQRVYDKVDFKLNYIGTPTTNDGVECKHGPSECMGNIIELCTRELYPDPKINLGFIMCLTRDYTHIPERALVEDCALEHAIDIKAINECAAKDDGAYGMDLLRHSIQRTSDVSTCICD